MSVNGLPWRKSSGVWFMRNRKIFRSILIRQVVALEGGSVLSAVLYSGCENGVYAVVNRRF